MSSQEQLFKCRCTDCLPHSVPKKQVDPETIAYITGETTTALCWMCINYHLEDSEE